MTSEIKTACESLKNMTNIYFHIRHQAWPVNDQLSHEHFLIFRDGFFNGGLDCLIWMVLSGLKMEFQQFFGWTDLFAMCVWTYIFSTVYRRWVTVKIIRQFHLFLVTLWSQLLQCRVLVKSASILCFICLLLLGLIKYGPPQWVKSVGWNFPRRTFCKLVCSGWQYSRLLRFAICKQYLEMKTRVSSQFSQIFESVKQSYALISTDGSTHLSLNWLPLVVISDRISESNLHAFLEFLSSLTLLMLFPLSLRWVPKESCGCTIRDNSFDKGDIYRSMKWNAGILTFLIFWFWYWDFGLQISYWPVVIGWWE